MKLRIALYNIILGLVNLYLYAAAKHNLWFCLVSGIICILLGLRGLYEGSRNRS